MYSQSKTPLESAAYDTCFGGGSADRPIRRTHLRHDRGRESLAGRAAVDVDDVARTQLDSRLLDEIPAAVVHEQPELPSWTMMPAGSRSLM